MSKRKHGNLGNTLKYVIYIKKSPQRLNVLSGVIQCFSPRCNLLFLNMRRHFNLQLRSEHVLFCFVLNPHHSLQLKDKKIKDGKSNFYDAF